MGLLYISPAAENSFYHYTKRVRLCLRGGNVYNQGRPHFIRLVRALFRQGFSKQANQNNNSSAWLSCRQGKHFASPFFLSEKYNLFLFDFRYFGRSGGTYSTAGAKEVEDLNAAVQFLKSRGVQEVGVWGFSMGGAVALMAAPQRPEIKAVASEASYASLNLMALELYRIPILKYPLAYLTSFWAKIFLGIDLKKFPRPKVLKYSLFPYLLSTQKTMRLYRSKTRFSSKSL